MFVPIVLCENHRVTQTKVTREIDHFQILRNSGRNLQGLSVRQREENAIKVQQTCQILWCFAESQISQAKKVAMDFANRFARMLVRSNESDLSVWMQQQYAQQFRTTVTRTAKDRDLQFHGQNRLR
jgi:hypothetical protein